MEEVIQDQQPTAVIPKYSRRKVFRNGCVLLLALVAGFLHYCYVSTLHENYFHFSHLSELERELTLRTEMGFYYSYYKIIVQERPFLVAISRLMYDRTVEYPKEVNAFYRFNIHPEVIVGGLYRYVEPWLEAECGLVARGGGLEPVQACEGLKEPVLFYLQAVWVLAGAVVAVLFLHATQLSGSILGGVVSVAAYFANHPSATRVQRAPAERENWTLAPLLAQACLLTVLLRRRHAASLQVSTFVLNCVCLLFWQLSQFIFLTQTAILFVMEQLRIIDMKTLCVFLHSHFCGLHMAVLLLQGNDMLKSSIYMSFFVVVFVYCLLFSSFRIKVKTNLDLFVEAWLVLLRICIVICASLYLKKTISDFLGTEDDNHIWELLLSKFTNYKSFHTLMYTCIDVFDFLPKSYFYDVSTTLLLPLTVYATVNYFIVCFSNAYVATKKKFNNKIDKKEITEDKDNKSTDNKIHTDYKIKNTDDKIQNTHEMGKADEGDTNDIDSDDSGDSGIENNAESVAVNKRLDLDKLKELKETKEKENDESESVLVNMLRNLDIDAAIFYNMCQMVVYGVMAFLFMRLKLLFTTQMCLVCSLALNFDVPFAARSRRAGKLVWGVVAGVVAVHVYTLVGGELAVRGEFSDYPLEELISWIVRSSPAGAVFAGSMPVSAAVLLSAGRAVVSHPHYEHKDARARAYAVHKLYGRFTPEELYEELSRLKATHLIVESRLCYGKTTQGCTLLDMWAAEGGAESPSSAPPPPPPPLLCGALHSHSQAEHFYREFLNAHYAVYRVHDLSVRYMPRVFDS